MGLKRICCGGGAWHTAKWRRERKVNGKIIACVWTDGDCRTSL